ncbi:hypothetical protein [Zavarzinella formosa]|uniref:hypothetical protein n=1 Tax=Zavarzinella formosa TaxID=360055 RepID=UPI00030B58A8|nr:hypothetical protein [Zavarzinella formosa]
MIRIRLIATAFLILAVMPGCGIFCHKERPCFPRLHALFHGNETDSTAGYPMMMTTGGGAPGCDSCNAGGMSGGPVISGPMMGVPGSGGMMTAPPMNTNPPGGRIPPAGIKESEGKQFELEGATKMGPGPVLAVPAGGLKNR